MVCVLSRHRACVQFARFAHTQTHTSSFRRALHPNTNPSAQPCWNRETPSAAGRCVTHFSVKRLHRAYAAAHTGSDPLRLPNPAQFHSHLELMKYSHPPGGSSDDDGAKVETSIATERPAATGASNIHGLCAEAQAQALTSLMRRGGLGSVMLAWLLGLGWVGWFRCARESRLSIFVGCRVHAGAFVSDFPRFSGGLHRAAERSHSERVTEE